MQDNAEWQSEAVHVLTDQLGVGVVTASNMVLRYARGEMLTAEEVGYMSKVLGVIGGMVGGYFVFSNVMNNPMKLIGAQSAGIAGMVRAAQGFTPNGCGEKYPLMTSDREGCTVKKGHKGLHVLINGFAFDEEDITWATGQMELLRQADSTSA